MCYCFGKGPCDKPFCNKMGMCQDFATPEEIIKFQWRNVPMPKDYTCGCGIYVHPTRHNPAAIHIHDCPYGALTKKNKPATMPKDKE